MIFKRLLLICSLIFFVESCSNSDLNGSFQLSATTDTTKASIGDLISYKIITHNIKDNYFEISQSEFSEPLELRDLKLLYDKRKRVKGAEFIFSVWDTGKVTIPPITINLFNADSIFDFAIETDSIVIEVVSLVDLTNNQNMKTIKGPMPIKTILPIRKISLILLLSIILYGLYYIYGKRIKNIDGEIKSKINIDPADKIALMKLDILIRESDYTKINIKEFYVNLSYILREYVENSVYIKSLEMTTEEIIRNKDFFPFNSDDIDIWLDILNRADLSKYAKSNPNEKICINDLKAGKNFIINTTSSWKILND